jgi:hypothetical protein
MPRASTNAFSGCHTTLAFAVVAACGASRTSRAPGRSSSASASWRSSASRR